jgi:hypothetical protein
MLTQVELLKDSEFIDQYSKFYRLDFTTYNPNTGLFSYIEFKCEFGNTGWLKPSFTVTSIDSSLYQQRDTPRLVLGTKFTCFTGTKVQIVTHTSMYIQRS